MIPEIAIGVVVGLGLARVLSVLARRLWEPIAVVIVNAWPKGQQLPTWFFVASELLTNERWDDQ